MASQIALDMTWAPDGAPRHRSSAGETVRAALVGAVLAAAVAFTAVAAATGAAGPAELAGRLASAARASVRPASTDVYLEASARTGAALAAQGHAAEWDHRQGVWRVTAAGADRSASQVTVTAHSSEITAPGPAND